MEKNGGHVGFKNKKEIKKKIEQTYLKKDTFFKRKKKNRIQISKKMI